MAGLNVNSNNRAVLSVHKQFMQQIACMQIIVFKSIDLTTTSIYNENSFLQWY